MPWVNLNTCLSFTETFGTTLKKLSSANCSEVIIYNNGALGLNVVDNNRTGAAFTFTIPASGQMTFRGITYSDSVSASYASGSGSVSYRTQGFSSFPLNVY